MTARPDSAEAFAALTRVSRETLDRLIAYEAVLRQWAPRMNLVGPSTLEQFWSRHVLDCHQLVAWGGPGGVWVDLGAGAGFPGLVLAAEDPGRRVVLIEANAKKCAFLRQAARAMEVEVEVRAERVENVSPFPATWVTARAFRGLPELMTHAMGFFELGADGLFLKGEQVHKELAEARKLFRFQARQHPSVTGSGCVLRVSEVEQSAHDGTHSGIG